MVKLWNFSSLVGPSWLILLCTMQEIMAISLVFILDLVILVEKVRDTSGGLALFISSMVHSIFLGSFTTISYLLQLLLYEVILAGFLRVNQHGPLIFLLRMKDSNKL